jgi:hypothetical protein
VSFSTFVTDVYGEILNRHSGTLAALKAATVRQLRELSSRRVWFMERSTTFTLPTAEPHVGEWAGEGAPGWPLDIREIDTLYYRASASSSWREVPGPVSINELRSWEPPLRVVESPLSIFPLAWAWWDRKLWVPRLSGDVSLKIDYWKDGSRDEATGVLITTASTNETNEWLDGRGATALRCGVLADYYLLPASKDETQASIEMGKRNVYLDIVKSEGIGFHGTALQAPMNL